MELEGWFLCQLIALIKQFMNIYLFIQSTFLVFDLHKFRYHTMYTHQYGTYALLKRE